MQASLRTIVFLAGLALAVVSAPRAHAQTSAPIDPNTMLASGQQALALIDGGRAAQLWDGGSSLIQGDAARKKDFLANVKKTRKDLGAAGEREWLAVERNKVLPGAVSAAPAGDYYNLRFLVRFRARVATELVSFRRDDDGIWRWVGYVVQ